MENTALPEHVFEGQSDWTSDDQMWYLPPGPGFFQNMGENTNITMTDQGVNMGGVDLLEYMAMDPLPFNNMDGSAPTYQ